MKKYVHYKKVTQIDIFYNRIFPYYFYDPMLCQYYLCKIQVFLTRFELQVHIRRKNTYFMHCYKCHCFNNDMTCGDVTMSIVDVTITIVLRAGDVRITKGTLVANYKVNKLICYLYLWW